MILQKFFTEVVRYSKSNWWVYIIYLLLLTIVFFSDSEHFTSAAIISSLHFVADIFIMMMFNAYSHNSCQEGTYFQIVSMLIFTSLKIYTGITHGGWHYIAADPIYILAAIKNYRKDVNKVDLSWINKKSMTFLSLLLMAFMIIYLKRRFDPGILNSTAKCIQTVGIFLFAIALTITGNERERYKFSMVALSAMVIGSAWETLNSLTSKQVAGLALSYFLLPLTVLVFYTKNWSHYMKNPPAPSK